MKLGERAHDSPSCKLQSHTSVPALETDSIEETLEVV